MSKTGKFYCNRPSWAARLMSCGYQAEIMANPWDSKLHTWCFEATPELCKAVISLFEEIGKEPPRVILEGCRGGADHE